MTFLQTLYVDAASLAADCRFLPSSAISHQSCAQCAHLQAPAWQSAVNYFEMVRVRSGSPEQIIDRTWETRCAAAVQRKRRGRSGRTTALIRAERAERVARWRRLLAEGVYPTRAALARAEGVSRAAVTQALRRR